MERSQLLAIGAFTASLLAGTAHAEEGNYGEPPTTVAPTSAAAWDVPGAVLIDGRDDLSESELSALLSEIRNTSPDAQFFDTDFDDATRIKVAQVAPSQAAALLRNWSNDPRLEHVEPLSWVKADFMPDDPKFSEQWNMERVGAESAWDYSTGRGVTVAVVDTGIACEDYKDFTKGSDLAETRCVPGWNLIWNNEHANDDQGHGTHVGGTIAQSTNNAFGVTGLAFHARLMPVKVLDKRGWGTTADVANGIRWAADNGAQVINLSLGGPRNSQIMQDAVDHARSRGVVVVASAGNSGGSVGFPGGSPGVIGVSATDQNDKLASFSSRGEGVDIGAPGVGVMQQTICDGGKNKCEIFPAWNGTSMASPHVAAAAAMLVALGVSDPDAVESRLAQSARVVDSSAGGKAAFGAGILDAASAARRVTLEHGLVRLALLLLFAAGAGMLAGRKNKSMSMISPGFVVGAILTGPGLFFLPLIASRVFLPLDVLARPLGELDLLVGASLHRLLPLANAGVVLALMVVGWHSRTLRAFAAGAGVGTAAFLTSTVLFGESFSPFGGVLFALWCLGNAAASLWMSRVCLAEAR